MTVWDAFISGMDWPKCEVSGKIPHSNTSMQKFHTDGNTCSILHMQNVCVQSCITTHTNIQSHAHTHHLAFIDFTFDDMKTEMIIFHMWERMNAVITTAKSQTYCFV